MILLTGAEGVVGRHLKAALQPAVCLEKMETFHDWCSHLFAITHEFELTAVVHCGAISANQYKDLDIFDWNAYATQVIANLCRDKGLYLIYFSSITAERPKTLYGHTKKISEVFIEKTAGLNACILRPFNIYGEGEDVRDAQNRSLPYRLADHELKTLWETERDYVHVSDVVCAVEHALKYRICGTYHLGTGEVTPSVVLANLVKYDGYTCEDRPPYIEIGFAADRSKFLPGWQPTVDVSSGVVELEKLLADEPSDPFDAVEISTKRASKNMERRNLSPESMRDIECSAEHRDGLS